VHLEQQLVGRERFGALHWSRISEETAPSDQRKNERTESGSQLSHTKDVFVQPGPVTVDQGMQVGSFRERDRVHSLTT
jgi:hypothetical protein